jgi:hypothetical protein
MFSLVISTKHYYKNSINNPKPLSELEERTLSSSADKAVIFLITKKKAFKKKDHHTTSHKKIRKILADRIEKYIYF